MAPWLTFVVGIIVGVLLGWLVDMLYRRAPRAVEVGPSDRASESEPPVLTSTAAPELPGVAAASTIAVAVTSDETLDVPSDSETAEASEEVNWREISGRVDEVAAQTNRPVTTARIASEMPDDVGLPPSAADTPAPTEDDPAKPN